MRRLPVWVFHGALDASVPVARSREMVAALRAAGSPVKYTEYPDVSHYAWSRAYVDPELHDWLFAQTRNTVVSGHTLVLDSRDLE